MKTNFLLIFLLVLTCSAGAQTVTNEPARLKYKVTCYEGKVGSRISGSGVLLAPDGTYPGNISVMSVTSAGHESELKWTFVGRSRDKDAYRFTFTRMTKVGSLGKTTTSKKVQFGGKQIVVFEDELHTVVMESPSAEDLKSAQKQ